MKLAERVEADREDVERELEQLRGMLKELQSRPPLESARHRRVEAVTLAEQEIAHVEGMLG